MQEVPYLAGGGTDLFHSPRVHYLPSWLVLANTIIVNGSVNSNPTFFHTGSAREPYNHGQWGSALRATPQATVGDVTDGQGLQTTCTFTCPWFPASLASLTD